MSRPALAVLSASLALALLAAQFVAIRLVPSEAIVRIVLPATVAAVPLALWIHRRYLGVWVMFVGLAANLAVILANGGLMPIERATVVAAVGEERAAEHLSGSWLSGSKDVVVDAGDGRFVALGDSVAVRLGGGGLVASPGDMVIWAGLLVLAAETSIAWHRRSSAVAARTHVAEKARGGAITRT
jgi:hypothetical protein